MIAIINYDAGNTKSVINALSRLGAPYILTDRKSEIEKSDKVILPGVGHARPAMDKLQNRGLIEVIKNLEQPFLGVCLGMQLMYDSSEEGDTKCLGMIPGRVKLFEKVKNIRVPHMGWNVNNYVGTQKLIMEGVGKQETYFVHSYYGPVNKYTVATCTYHYEFSAYINKDNFHGLQFHPEKSGSVGEKILQNFLEL